MTDKQVQITKRDNTLVAFNSKAIYKAVFAAAVSIGVVDPQEVATLVENKVKVSVLSGKLKSVEGIQDAVEHVLLVSKWKQVAKSYISYRHERSKSREMKLSMFQDIEALINQDDAELLSENANRDSRIIPTIKSLVAETVGKHYARNYILPKIVITAHDSGDLHVHDLGEFLYPIWNCMLIDLETMLRDGFTMGNAKIESPSNILTACSVAAQVVTAVGSHIYGGNTLPKLDLVLAPYVQRTYQKHLSVAEDFVSGTEDDLVNYAKAMTLRDVKSGIQALYYQVNTIVSSQGQTVFCTFTCGDGTSWESRMIQEAILLQQMEGLGKEKKTFVFPKLVFEVRKGVNFSETDPNYDMFKLAAKCSAKRLYPDILFMDTLQDKIGTQALPMGCRSFLAPWDNSEGEAIYNGRNNLGVVTVNIVRCAIKAKGNINLFWKLLDEVCEVAKVALMKRIERFEGVKASVAPILYCSGAMGTKLALGDEVMQLFKDGRASISLGYLGIHEAIYALFGKDIKGNHEAFGLEIVQQLRSKTDLWKEETGFGFSTYSTPAESLCLRFNKLDEALFGEIPEVTSKGYYTNSFHRTVEDNLSFIDKAKFESPYPVYASGGFIQYGEYPSMIGKEEALLQSWKAVSEYAPYWGTNLPSDQCFKCDFEGEFTATSKGFCCPSCNNSEEGTCSVIRRITGYLGSIDARPVNKGKHKEMIKRVKHS